MATSPTSQSALLSGAAKDDVVGLNNNFTFTIDQLLGNDPGGAAKVNLETQFFFGDTVEDQENQEAYLLAHGIKFSPDNGGTYEITAGAKDFSYFVQIGNRGTWSQADVEVAATPPHVGEALFTENFDGYEGEHYTDNGVPVFAVVDLEAENEWTGAEHTELGADGYGGIDDTSGESGGYWLDTQNTPGQINIEHVFTDTTAAVGDKTSVLSFDMATQSLDYNGQHYATDPDASFEFRIDDEVVAHIDAKDFEFANEMQHFEFDIAAYADAGSTHTLELVDTSGVSGVTGFAIDSIQINDWIV